MKSNNIDIAIICDDNYAHYAAETIVSILKSSNPEYIYNFHIINEGFSTKTKTGFYKILEKFSKNKDVEIGDNNKIHFINALDSKYRITSWDKLSNFQRIASYRLRLSSFLPNIDKVIYTDCDVLFQNDLTELWNEDISNYYIGICNDKIKKYQTNIKAYFIKRGISDKDFNLDKYKKYYNSGLILMNLKEMRKDKVEQKLLKCIDKYNFLGYLLDQDLINLVCYDKAKELNIKWNFLLSYFRLNRYKVLKEYRKDLVYLKKHYKNIGMIHFAADKNKPTVIYYWNIIHILTPFNKYKKLFWNNLKLTDWKDKIKYTKKYLP